MRKHAGFTLIEVMCVIGVIGIVTAVSIPNMMSWRADLKLDSWAREVFSSVQAARLRAVRDNARVVVSFDVGDDSYVAFVDNGAGGDGADNGVLDEGEVLLKQGTAPKGVHIDRVTIDGGAVSFDSRGTPTVNGAMLASSEEIHLKGETGRGKGVRISVAGIVSVFNSVEAGYY